MNYDPFFSIYDCFPPWIAIHIWNFSVFMRVCSFLQLQTANFRIFIDIYPWKLHWNSFQLIMVNKCLFECICWNRISINRSCHGHSPQFTIKKAFAVCKMQTLTEPEKEQIRKVFLLLTYNNHTVTESFLLLYCTSLESVCNGFFERPNSYS